MLADGFSWDIILDAMYVAVDAYDYDKHHFELIEWSNNDVMIVGVAGLVGIAWHQGDLDVAGKQIEKMFDGNRRSSQESNETIEAIGLTLCCSSMASLFAYQLGFGDELCVQMKELGFTWDDAVASTTKYGSSMPTYFRAHGSREMEGMIAMDAISWQAKMLYVLVASWRDVPKADVILAVLPSPDELSEFLAISENAATKEKIATGVHFVALHLIAALVCEKFGQLDDALVYVDVIFTREPNRGGDYKTTSKISGLCLKGRILAAQGRKDQAEAAFEAAIEQAEAHQLNLMIALALRDIQKCVFTSGPRNRAIRSRLGAVLRKLKGPADKLSILLGDGLDATQLMLL